MLLNVLRPISSCLIHTIFCTYSTYIEGRYRTMHSPHMKLIAQEESRAETPEFIILLQPSQFRLCETTDGPQNHLVCSCTKREKGNSPLAERIHLHEVLVPNREPLDVGRNASHYLPL